MNSSSDYYYLRNTLKDLLLARSVKRGDFVLASGRRSSFYIDARLTTMSGDGLAVVGGLGLDRMAVRGWSPRAVGGLTLGADPIAYALALTARRRGQLLDAFTVRKQPKDHGTGQRIEGCFASGFPVVIVEDVLTTGRSAREAISAVETNSDNSEARITVSSKAPMMMMIANDSSTPGRERLRGKATSRPIASDAINSSASPYVVHCP